METKKYFVLLYFCFLTTQSFIIAQNLIPNGGFEEFIPTDNPYAPKKLTELTGGWETFTNTVSPINEPQFPIYGKVKDPKNKNMIVYRNFQSVPGKEWIISGIQVPLLINLKKDCWYSFSFEHKLSFVETITSDSIVDSRLIQFCVLEQKINHVNEIPKLSKDILIAYLPKGKSIQKYKIYNWERTECNFKAKGEEKYLLFGTFDTIYCKHWCIFWIDNVQLTETGKPLDILSNIEVGSTLILENILFETNSSILQNVSYNTLNQLISELNINPKLKLEISGHTDNVGTDEHNQILSEQRAQAVVNFLVKNGIASDRLTFKGYGNTKPVADNSTEEGKAKNRRVEIKVIDK
ncbi:MAG: OmpA family protein [Bacteroidales bacterium]